jgi:hypothetical protein
MPSPFTASTLIPGRTYRVILPFNDYDGQLHSPGETWRFTHKNFLPYEDGLTLFIEQNGQQHLLRLQWRAETQAEIIDNFSHYVEELPLS